MLDLSNLALKATIRSATTSLRRGHFSIPTWRRNLDWLGSRTRVPADVRVSPSAAPPGLWVWPSSATADRVLLFLHGGGLLAGSPTSHAGLAAELATRLGTGAFLPEYRLAPEHRVPAQVEDALAAYRHLLTRPDAPVAPDKLLVGGDSAGGGLAVSLMFAVRDAGLPMPAGLLLLSPWTDMTLSGASLNQRAPWDPMLSPELLRVTVDHCLADGDAHQPLASPLFGDLTGLPPMRIVVGGDEVLLDDSLRLVARAREVHVPAAATIWPGKMHVFPFAARLLPAAREALDELATFGRFALEEGLEGATHLLAQAPTLGQN